MNEFLKIQWRANHPSQLDSMFTFLDDASICNSYIYKNFQKSIKPPPQKPVKSLTKSAPHVPGLNELKKIRRRSLLTKREKLQCLKALKLIQSGKSPAVMTKLEKDAVQMYNECQSKIIEENARFLDFVRTNWKYRKQQPLKIQAGLYKYARQHWLDKIKKIKDYPQFYQPHSLISLNYNENEDTILCNCVQNVVEMGQLARFSSPNLQEICQLKIATLPQLDYGRNSKLPVSFDQNIVKILENNPIDVVISSSGIQQIIDNSDLNTKWNLPVVVKEINCFNTKRKVVFIDKVLPKTNPNCYDFKRFTYKQLLRSNFCQYEAFTFPNEDIPVEIDGTATISNGKSAKKIYHNVSYRLWNIKKISQSCSLMKNKTKNCDINVLVRTKLDSCEMTDQGVLSPIVLATKIEQQIEFGANIASKSELVRSWAKLFFHPFSNLYRVRVKMQKPEVVSVEKCTIQKITNEASTHHQIKTNLCLGIFQTVLQELYDLPIGNYMLQHLPKHGSFVAILKQSNESNDSCYDLYGDYNNCEIDRKTHPEWLPIDVNYILPSHEASNMIPAVFDGFDDPTNRTTIKKRKRRKKKKQTMSQNESVL